VAREQAHPIADFEPALPDRRPEHPAVWAGESVLDCLRGVL
jgi:hypothetical protein